MVTLLKQVSFSYVCMLLILRSLLEEGRVLVEGQGKGSHILESSQHSCAPAGLFRLITDLWHLQCYKVKGPGQHTHTGCVRLPLNGDNTSHWFDLLCRLLGYSDHEHGCSANTCAADEVSQCTYDSARWQAWAALLCSIRVTELKMRVSLDH